MANDKLIGGGILAGSIIGVIVYGLLIWYWTVLVLEISAFLAVFALLAILGWIGYTMATTPPPEPITDIPEMPTGPVPDSTEQKPT
ncbi:MAG: transcriptional regulator [Thaumarchaeota archaeon]|nr:transcriptional regulator [Nitrososphaerota archaeon]